MQGLQAHRSGFCGLALPQRAAVLAHRPVRPIPPCTSAVAAVTERFRLNNLGPQPGSRPKNKRKGRGYGAGQVCCAGFRSLNAGRDAAIISLTAGNKPRLTSRFTDQTLLVPGVAIIPSVYAVIPRQNL